MSDLSKFEDSSEFRHKLKEYLHKPYNTKPAPAVVPYSRFSFDVSADLEQTIEEKLIASGKKLPRKEQQQVNKMDEITFASNNNALNNVECEDSFLTYEQICNKSASDPESTLYEYIHSDHKKEVLANAISRHSHNEQEHGNEVAAESMHKFCKNYLDTHQLEDMTQLADVEAPSKLWENTLMNDEQTLVTSPVKMMHLLRPSTIIEESETICNRESARSNVYSVATSYATAADCTASTQAPTEPYYSLGSEELQSIEMDDCNASVQEASNLNELMSLLNVTNTSYDKEEEEISFNYDKSLKNLSTTELIILNDDKKRSVELTNESAALEHLNDKQVVSLNETKNDFSLNDSVIEIVSDDEEEEEEQDYKENKINISDSLLNISGETYVTEEKVEQSPTEFNDTLEEVDYLMRKGMELRLAQQQKQQEEQKMTPTIPILPLKVNKFSCVLSPKCDNSPKSQNRTTVNVNSGKKATVAANLVKPMPKFEFKMPTGSATKKTPSHKLTVSKRFDHIKSPISMYVKHGVHAPLMANMKSKTSELDVKNSSIFSKVEKQRPFFKNTGKENQNLNNSYVLPEKKYISAILKQVVDDRTPMTIPGGPKMQQYIQPALMRSVIKHNGKVHLNPVQRELFKLNSPRKQPQQLTIDDSLRDVSMISGDVSLCTIKDANKY